MGLGSSRLSETQLSVAPSPAHEPPLRYRLLFNGPHYEFYILPHEGELLTTRRSVYLNVGLGQERPRFSSLILALQPNTYYGVLFGGIVKVRLSVTDAIQCVIEATEPDLLLTVAIIAKSGSVCTRLSPVYILAPFHHPTLHRPPIAHLLTSQDRLCASCLTMTCAGQQKTYRHVFLKLSPRQLSLIVHHGIAYPDPFNIEQQDGWEGLESEAQEYFKDLGRTITVLPLLWRRPDTMWFPGATFFDTPIITWPPLSWTNVTDNTMLCSQDLNVTTKGRRLELAQLKDIPIDITFFQGTGHEIRLSIVLVVMNLPLVTRFIRSLEHVINHVASQFCETIDVVTARNARALLNTRLQRQTYHCEIDRRAIFESVIKEVKRKDRAPRETLIPRIVFKGEQGMDMGGLLKELLSEMAVQMTQYGLVNEIDHRQGFKEITPEYEMGPLSAHHEMPARLRVLFYRRIGYLMGVAMFKQLKFPIYITPALIFLISRCRISTDSRATEDEEDDALKASRAKYYGEGRHNSFLWTVWHAIKLRLMSLLGLNVHEQKRFISYLDILINGGGGTSIPGIGSVAIKVHPFDALALYMSYANADADLPGLGYYLYPDLKAYGMDECLNNSIPLDQLHISVRNASARKYERFCREGKYYFYNIEEVPTGTGTDGAEGLKLIPYPFFSAETGIPSSLVPIYACHVAYFHLLGSTYYELCAIADGLSSFLGDDTTILESPELTPMYLYTQFFSIPPLTAITPEDITRYCIFEGPIDSRKAFVEAFMRLTGQERATLLQFCTGVPYLGHDTRIVVKMTLPRGYLPQGRTCANILELPREVDAMRMLLAIQKACQHMYFGFI
ncbi:putative HECT type ubiquitin ligase [Giardia muris]|uniref:HECT-type E3 ubiquitin transferase n=1 Tax=Giardia muris TaxID=5742 RepID=A0A4Z1T1P8_GIAMU|nr:putative HECT type ubiquitin ligase [Giardia muris]|eukprot:TNJ29628.1 putative HECT type ubiquitin ligase [Giardia muris]